MYYSPSSPEGSILHNYWQPGINIDATYNLIQISSVFVCVCGVCVCADKYTTVPWPQGFLYTLPHVSLACGQG